MNAALDKVESQREHFDRVAQDYVNARKSPRHRMLRSAMWSHFFAHPAVDLTRFDQPLRVLEPMCGSCEGRKLLEENFDIELSYKGFDYAANMVDYARQAYPDADIWQADATKFDGSAHQVDVVMIAGGIHHVSAQAETVVARLSQALRPGGLFIVAEPTHNNPVLRWVRERIYERNGAFDAETERGFTTDELDRFFEKAGLVPVRKSYPTLLAYVLWGCPEAFPALDRGPLWLARAWVFVERTLWNTAIAKWMGFGTFAAYRKSQ